MKRIEDKNYFSNEELYDLLNTLISEDYLFYNIGSKNDDSVLRRILLDLGQG